MFNFILQFTEIFRDQIALDFIKADYDGFLDKNYFDDWRWQQVQQYIQEYRLSHISHNGGKTLLKISAKRLLNKLGLK